ncbi:MAG: LacI family DNA-binding transcriptional regulator [Candidatus Hydrogenedentes bacterium]|nr:LacI family DNA-binding transcriptional regulator [Candidatus Hydrogenedentota bacterium]
MSLTIHDIARHLGVSTRTIGRVLNNLPGVGEETRQRVAQYVREVDYQPHTAARNLRQRRSDCIGVALNSAGAKVPLSQELLGWLFGELHRIFGRQGEYIQFDLSPPRVDDYLDYGRLLLQQRCGALIVAGPIQIHDPVITRLHRSGKPYLAMSRLDSLPEISSAAVDYESGAYQATRYLAQKGHKRIGLLLGLKGFQPGIERLRGYRRALEEAGLPWDEQIIHPTTFDPGATAEALHQLLHHKDITGILDCSGTEDAAGLREGARRAGRMIGNDLEMVVWTYSYQATVLSDAAAHVWLPVREASSEGLELLADWFYGRRSEPFQVLYTPVLYETIPQQELTPRTPVFGTNL